MKKENIDVKEIEKILGKSVQSIEKNYLWLYKQNIFN